MLQKEYDPMKNLINSIFIFVLLIAGCAGVEKKDVAVVPDSQKKSPSIATASSGLEVEFDAKAKGNEVLVRVKNNTPAPIRVSPYFFALIIDNEKPEIRYNPSSAISKFPATRLLSGMEVSGIFLFKNYKDLAEQKLVFNSPDHKPLMTIIKAESPGK
jgi:hypothetical protein